jgi:predicted metal-dependent phosphotriesterase family hydrolase
MIDFRSRLTRREALELLAVGTAAAVLPGSASAQSLTFPRGAIIRTVLKDYAPEDLAGGATLFHEHLSLGTDFNARFTAASAAARASNGPAPAPIVTGRGAGGGTAAAAPAAPPAAANAGRAAGPPPAPAGPNPMSDPKLMAQELMAAKDEGVACIVDGGHPDSGRDINFLRQAAMLSRMPIVAGGGFYAQPWYPKEISTMSENQIVEALIKQADDDTLGAWGEIGSWDEITADERKVFRAIGRAQVATNIPIFTHTGIPGKAALEQLNILEDAGVPLDKVVIGHMGNLADANVYVHKIICRRGAYVGFDRQGGGGDANVVPMVLALLDAGYGDRMLFSADTMRGYGKTMTVFLPKLKAAGVSDEILRRIMVDNSRRWLAFVPKRPRKRG